MGERLTAKHARHSPTAALPGTTGTEKAANAEKWLLAAVEEYDNYIPVLGAFIDLPIIDSLEAAVRSAIAWEYAAMELEAA